MDVSHRRKISGVGHIGNEGGRGFFVPTVLAVRPRENNAPNRASEKSAKRMSGCARCRPLGGPEPASLWVHVGDRAGRGEVPARYGPPGRWTHLQLACGQMTLLPPRARATSEQGALDRVGHWRP